jgi:hypothetical protein
MALYYAGDSVGAMAEGGAPGSVTYEDAMKGLQVYPNGTDESDVARLFLEYVAKEDEANEFDLWGWCVYHTENRAATRYGKTWKDHFSTVKHIAKTGRNLSGLLHISQDRASMGNGILALAYPAAYAQMHIKQCEDLCKISHWGAVRTFVLARKYFGGVLSLEELEGRVIDTCMRTANHDVINDRYELTPLAPFCLWAAIQVAKQPSVEDAIRFALSKGGDVDSYLSLGLLIWGFERIGDLLSD